jgi:hypothetical protein
LGVCPRRGVHLLDRDELLERHPPLDPVEHEPQNDWPECTVQVVM